MSERPPVTRAEGWLRTILWLSPSAYATLVVWFGGRIPPRMYLWPDQIVDRAPLWIISTLVLMGMTGCTWSLFKVERPLTGHWSEMAVWTLWFCVMQTLIVPIVAGTSAVAVCFLKL